MARKIRDVRILRDEQSVGDVDAPVLLVSQFTLYGDARKGRRPTWSAAAPGPVSEPLYEAVCASWSGSAPTSSGASSARTCGSRRSTTGPSPSCSTPPPILTTSQFELLAVIPPVVGTRWVLEAAALTPVGATKNVESWGDAQQAGM